MNYLLEKIKLGTTVPESAKTWPIRVKGMYVRSTGTTHDGQALCAVSGGGLKGPHAARGPLTIRGLSMGWDPVHAGEGREREAHGHHEEVVERHGP